MTASSAQSDDSASVEVLKLKLEVVDEEMILVLSLSEDIASIVAEMVVVTDATLESFVEPTFLTR